MPRDLAAHLMLAFLCYGLSAGRLTLALPAIATLVAALNLCNAGKIAFYGTPVMPDDFLAMRNLFMLLTGWQLAGAVAIVVLPISLLLVMIAWRRRQTWMLLGHYDLDYNGGDTETRAGRQGHGYGVQEQRLESARQF